MTYGDWSEVVATSDDGKLRVVLQYDTDCERPMDSGDHWMTSVLPLAHRGSYDREAEYDPEGRLSAWQDFNQYRQVPDADAAFIRWMRVFHGIEVQVDGWGSDQTNALVWVEPSEYDRLGVPHTLPAADIIKGELDQHQTWANGECYGYVIEKLTTWREVSDDPSDTDPATRQTWEDTGEACWGYVGREYAESEATEALAGHRD